MKVKLIQIPTALKLFQIKIQKEQIQDWEFSLSEERYRKTQDKDSFKKTQVLFGI